MTAMLMSVITWAGLGEAGLVRAGRWLDWLAPARLLLETSAQIPQSCAGCKSGGLGWSGTVSEAQWMAGQEVSLSIAL